MRISRWAVAASLASLAALAGTAAAAPVQVIDSVTFGDWPHDTVVYYPARTPGDVYLDEMGRPLEGADRVLPARAQYLDELRARWELIDRRDEGMTPAEISRITGKVDSSTGGMPKSGAGVQPGNMGPANSKGQ